MVNVVCKMKELDSAWSLILERIGCEYEGAKLVTMETFAILIRRYSRAGMHQAAVRTLKTMISRGFLPTPTTYNYFFRHFAIDGKIEEGMNLYTKMIESGYTPDRLTYHLLLKLLCENEKLNLAIQVAKEMRIRGCDMDLATSTMLIHLLSKMHRFDEAMAEFEDMIRRGVVPQYLTFQRMSDEFQKRGMNDMARKLSYLMSSVPHSTNFPNKYTGTIDAVRARRSSIFQKAEAMSDVLKTCKNPRKLVKRRKSLEGTASDANWLIEDIRKRSPKDT